MKRIYENIPLQSILYVVPGTAKIVIEDYTRQGILWENSNKPVYTWEGKVCETTKLPYKYSRAKVYHVSTHPEDPGTLLFKVSTEFEQY